MAKDINLKIFKDNISNAQAQLREQRVKLEFYQHLMKCEVWKDKAYRAARTLDFDYILGSKEFTAEEKAPVEKLKARIKSN